jgi:tetratricopeptide (TPR) repeat protein
MMLVLPVGLLGAVRALAARPRWLPAALCAAAAAALLLPGHLVMSNYTQPIHRLDQEWAALQNPPAVLRSETYEQRAREALERRDFPQAEINLTLAIKLADNPARPSEQRGILYATGRHWAEARRDFDTAVKFAPEDPDAWFLRAQAALALGDVPAARADFQRALAVGSPEWAARPEVTRVRVRIEQEK